MRRLGALILVLAVIGAVAWATGLVPDGSDGPERQPLLVLGDSLCVGARDDGGHLTDALHEAGWEPEYACGNGVPIATGIEYVVGVDAVPDDVVVALGTNRVPDGEDLAEQLATLRRELVARGAQRIVWVDYATSAGGFDAENAVLHQHVATNLDVLVLWSERSAGELDYFQPDTVHHTMLGKQAWVRGIVDALGAA